jgi:hypothetical protein
MRATPWLVGLLGCALAGWWLAPLPQAEPALVQPRGDTWAPVRFPHRPDTSALVQQAAAAPFWGPQPTGNVAPDVPQEPRWRVAGLFGEGRQRTLFLEFVGSDRPPQRLRAGDKLPSGHVITRIGERDYCVRIAGKEYRMGIERSGS